MRKLKGRTSIMIESRKNWCWKWGSDDPWMNAECAKILILYAKLIYIFQKVAVEYTWMDILHQTECSPLAYRIVWSSGNHFYAESASNIEQSPKLIFAEKFNEILRHKVEPPNVQFLEYNCMN